MPRVLTVRPDLLAQPVQLRRIRIQGVVIILEFLQTGKSICHIPQKSSAVVQKKRKKNEDMDSVIAKS